MLKNNLLKPMLTQFMESEVKKMPKHAYSVKEAAEQMSMSRATVYELMRRGKLAYVMVGRHRIIRAAAIERFLEENETQKAG